MHIVLALILCTALVSGCSKPSGPPEKVTISVGSAVLSAPVYVAMDRGYFKEEELAVSLQPTLTGADALQTVVAGKADMATCTETPVMQTVMEGRKIYILATIADSETTDAIVARKDRGISTPHDLQGRTIGVPPIMNIEYFLDTFLLDNKVSKTKTRIDYVKVDELGQALLSGKVDAVCIWEPYLSALLSQLGGNGQAFYGIGSYKLTWHVVAMQDFAKKHPDTVKKVLRALIKARGFIIEHPDAALQITANHLHVDKSSLAVPWKGYNFDISLRQSVLISLQEQARWALQRKGGESAVVPGFLDSFYTEGLKSIDPTLVSVGD